ncbi:amino acid adenylation domain-containing protein [Tenacibaculum sp. MAR_2009_124]|uniref:non-ribosomal peptide synthetase n=1 Tax=Tenacibaculum sp. MAR_2009_124 TaxID=1250059 RepID=UPI0008965CA1|nr:non-ribosomal peptide synthetase [Tenacibaculum sp. MAR_2009_124]SEC23137.1 amino acid adenylation domain-containing protein [Tenacibaculum sp. MAR_2009_124]
METMNITTFFRKLHKEGITLILKDGSLNVKANSEINSEIIAEIKANKNLIVKHLKSFENNDISEQLLEKIIPYNKEELDHIPLSFGQERLWFIDKLQGSSEEYHIPSIIRLNTELEIPILERSLKTIVARHEILRTVIYEKDGIGYQNVLSEDNWSLSKVLISKEADLESEIDAFVSIPFDLAKDYMFRACLYDLGKNEYVLAFVTHHIASDGWSSEILSNEFVTTYAFLDLEDNLPLPKLELQYSDYAIWQRNYFEKELLEGQLAYWKEKLKGTNTLSLPIDYKRTTKQNNKGNEVLLELDENLNQSLNALFKQQGVTPFMFLLTAFKVLLHRYSGQNDICIGTPIANRTQSELEDLIGFFANTLALRSDLSGNPSFKELLSQVKQTTLKSYDNQLVPFEKVVDSVVTDRDMTITPLFQVMFDYQNDTNEITERDIDSEEESIEEDLLSISGYETSEISVQFDLTLSVIERESNFFLNMAYRSSLFKEETIQRIMTHFKHLLNSIVNNIDQSIGELSMLTEVEKVQLVKTFNKTDTSNPENKTLIDLFSEQVTKTPEAAAVVYEKEILTYKKLDEYSNQLAHYLKEQGVKSGTLVGVCIDRSPEMISSILGILKSGGVYVPIDPDYPLARINYMLDDANIKVVLSRSVISKKTLIERDDITKILLDSHWGIITNYSSEKLNQTLTGEDLAYIIYTSGSTGKPKGVMIEHKNLINLCLWHQTEYSVNHTSRGTLFSGISFDASIWEIYPYLISGASLYPISRQDRYELNFLKTFFNEHEITHTYIPTLLCNSFIEENFNLTNITILTGGDALILNKTTNLKIYNNYGPTETTVVASNYKLTDTSTGKISIGKPINNTQIYITDPGMNLVPIGVVGELCVSGQGVARGYLKREELTNQKFIINRFKEGSRIYKTGDLARWLPDGNIEFIGRIDNQVQIRGYRIELGEIEKALSNIKSIHQSCVLAKEDTYGSKRLLAYVVPEGKLNKDAVETQLKESLPHYMIPTLWIELDKFPLTANGKLDKKALPEIETSKLSAKKYVAPRNQTEKELVQIWQDLLGIDKVGIYDNFFELGGHSLLVIQLISRSQKLGYHMEVRDIFLNPTIASVKEKLLSADLMYQVPENGITTTTKRIIPSMVPLLDFSQEDIDKIVSNIEGSVHNIQDIYPLSPLQEGIYFHYLLNNEEQDAKGDPYILPHLLSFPNKDKRSSFINALQFVVNRHDVLRTCILSEGLPHAVQVVLRNVLLPEEIITVNNSKDVLSELELLISPGNQWMDLSKAPLLQLRLVDDFQNNNYYLIINQHHLILDHVGMEKITHEIEEYLSCNKESLAEPVLYRNFIGHTLHLQKTNDSKFYFQKLLKNIDEPTYPFGLSDIQGDGSTLKEFEDLLPSNLSKEIRNTCIELGVSPAVLFHAAFGLVVGKCSNSDYALFGSLFSGRLQGSLGASDSLGLFINTLPFFIELKRNTTEYINEVRQKLGELLAYEQTSLSSVQGWSDISNDIPFFSAILNFRHSSVQQEEEEEEEEEEEIDSIDSGVTFVGGHERSNYPFSIDVDDFGIDFGLKVQVDGDIEADRVIAFMEKVLIELLHGLKSDQKTSVHSFSILPQKEEDQLLNTNHNTYEDLSLDQTIVDLFEDQAIKTPKAIAIVSDDHSITYEELDKRSNQLAHYIRNNYSSNSNYIGVLLKRDIDLIISFLGILKSENVYIPIDISFPSHRVEHIIKDSGLALIITKSSNNELIQFQSDFQKILLDSDDKLISNEPVHRLPITKNTNNEAYVIYTSGTTGNPKGVVVNHLGITNAALSWKSLFEVDNQTNLLQLASAAFDVFIGDLCKTLLFGGKMVICPDDLRFDLSALYELIERHKITLFETTPALGVPLMDFIYDNNLDYSSIKQVILGSDVFHPHDFKRLYENFGNNIRITNSYGLTEATIDSSYYEAKSISELSSLSNIPIGKPLYNTQFYILDNTKNLVPQGIIGELYIGGLGLAKKYLNNPQLTNKKFINNHFQEKSRLYKTGDLARRLPDGNIEFIGRADNQVKIRGYRIELGEIENALFKHESILNCCVLAKNDTNGNKCLIAYVVLRDKLNKELLQEELKMNLPDYMIPNLWVQLEEIPLTANGKLDRKSLPTPNFSELSSKEYVTPRNEKEKQLVAIWEDLLNIEKVGVHDNFFELGGHSLLVIKLISQIQKNGFHIKVKDIFANPTIEAICKKLAPLSSVYQVPVNGISDSIEHITPSMLPLLDFEQEDIDKIVSKTYGGVPNIQDIYPLSPLQEGMYYHYLISGKNQGDPYVLPHLLSFSEKKDRLSFIEALQFVVNRHDVLRTCFLSEGLPKPVQVVLKEAKLSIEHLHFEDSKNILSELELLTIPGEQKVDVSKAPLLNLKTIDDPLNDEYYIILLEHHLIMDHIGMETLVSEITSYLEGQASNLPTPFLYRNFIGHTLHQQSTNDSESYFKELLGDIDTPSYPFEFANTLHNVNTIKEANTLLPETTSKEIRRISTELGTSPAIIFYAIYGILVGKCSNKNYAIFGSLFSGRLQGSIGASDALGLFINTLPFFCKLNGTVLEYVLQVKEKLEELLPFEQTPLSNIQNWSGISNEIPLFSALLNYRHSFEETEGEEEESIDFGIDIVSSKERTNYPFTFSIDDYGIDYGITAQISGNLMPEKALKYFVEILNKVVASLKSDGALPLHELSILTEEEQDEILNTFNNTTYDYPESNSVITLFKEQVSKTPNATALCFNGESLTYKELDNRSNQLANYLISKGVEKGTRIGLLFDRNFNMIISMLGVLKSGCSYIPLDPLLPKNRLAYILEDADVKYIILSEEILLENASISSNIETLNIKKSLAQKASEIQYIKTNDSEAYVMYTSGTTGTPKGISISDENITSLVNNPSDKIAITSSDRVLQWSNYAFDGCTYEIFGSLLNGATLYLIPSQMASNPIGLLETINKEKLTVAFITTALFNALSECDLSLLSSLRLLLFGGEKVAVMPVKRMLTALGQNKILHVYGPTETTTYASCEVVSEISPEALTIPIGKPLSNTNYYVLDEHEKLVPVGVVGELCISGKGVSTGYLNRDELTNQCFVNNPYKKGERIYKTGDLVKWLPNGSIEFVGRKDDQVKISGYRIELTEIENVLGRINGIQNNCVLVEDNGNRGKRLIAYVVPEEIFDKEAIQSELTESLPDYMIPKIWVELDQLPLTSNGKLDKKNLPKPEFGLDENYVAPTTKLEEDLCVIWQDVLCIDKVGIKDDFFRIGGNSIKAIKVSNEMSKILGLKIQITDIIRYKSIGILAAIYSKLQAYENHVSLVMPFHQNYDNNLPDIIFIHSALGGSDAYYCLAELLEGQYNCIGIDNHNIYGSPKINKLNQLAHFYIKEYTEKYSFKDPITLLGWSLGGSIALEMAFILESKGYSNINVILLDTYVHKPKKFSRRARFNREENYDFISSMFPEEYEDYVERLVDAAEQEHTLGQTAISGQLFKTKVTLFQALYKDNLNHGSNDNNELVLIKDLKYNNLERVIDVNRISIIPTHSHHRHILPFQAQFIGDYLSKNKEKISNPSEFSKLHQ